MRPASPSVTVDRRLQLPRTASPSRTTPSSSSRSTPFEERRDPELSVQAIIGAGPPQLAAHPGCATVLRLQPAADHRPRHRPAASSTSSRTWPAGASDELAAVMRGLVVAANQQPELTRRLQHLRRQHAAALPRHRPRQGADARRPVSDVFNALQATLGGYYVNDFNLFGRTWQVNIQADSDDRTPSTTSTASTSATSAGEMVPCARWPRCALVLGPQALTRYNNYRSVTINGAPAPGVSTGDALAAMERHLGRDPAARLRLRMDRHGAAGEGGGGPDRHHPRARRAVRLPVPGRALRELDHPDPGAAVGHGRRPRRARRAPGSPGSASTSTPRSASSC